MAQPGNQGNTADVEGSLPIPALPQSFSMEVNQALLKEDDDLLRQIFSQVFRHHHPSLANKVDVIFSLAQVRGHV